MFSMTANSSRQMEGKFFLELKQLNLSAFTILGTNSAGDIYNIFIYYFLRNFRKIDFDITCKLSPKETICMKRQSLLSGKNKNIIQNVVC